MAIQKKKGCTIIKEWFKSANNHLHWSAFSSHGHDKQMIVEKWKSFLNHIQNIHIQDNALFPKCTHLYSLT